MKQFMNKMPMTKAPKLTSRRKLLDDFLMKLKSLGRHIFIEYTQTCSYHQCIKRAKQNEVTVAIDFAENYACLRQGDAQSAYRSRNPVQVQLTNQTECSETAS